MTIWDPIRSQSVPASPEEVVRQKLIQKMIGELGYPKGLLAVEKSLSTGRRFDIVCYALKKDQLVPLLLVECKAKSLKGAKEQAFGYMNELQTPFICLANETEVKTMWREKERIVSIPFLPLYTQLVEKLCI